MKEKFMKVVRVSGAVVIGAGAVVLSYAAGSAIGKVAWAGIEHVMGWNGKEDIQK